MVMFGGGLFADLLLGLAMLFFTANTVGQPMPTATPTATPDLLATSEAARLTQSESAAATATAQAAAAAATATAQAGVVFDLEASATAISDSAALTAVARATLDA